jgi:hypothetical protein
MRKTIGRLVLLILVSLIAIGPLLVGLFPIIPGALIPVFIILFSVYAFREEVTRAKQVVTILLSVSFALTLCELVSRPIMAYLRDDRPKQISPHSMSRLPQLYRYLKNVQYQGSYYGDLAIMARKKEWREPRALRFITDEFGFRNEPGEPEDQAKELDLIMLGDSFGEGLGTTQELTWSTLLERYYGFRIYNLSMDGAGPWQEYVNLLLEIDRLRINEKTIVVWAFFTGNDLGDEYLPQLEKETLPWLSAFGSFRHSLKSFRDNAQLRRIIISPFTEPIQEQVFVRTFLDGRPLPFSHLYVTSTSMSEDEVMRHPNYGMLKETVKAMRKLADQKRFEVLVVSIPCKEEVYSWVVEGKEAWTASKEHSGFSRALHVLSSEARFQFLDLKPSLIDASRSEFKESGKLLYWRDDTHWNDSGYRIAASVVSRELESIRNTSLMTK